MSWPPRAPHTLDLVIRSSALRRRYTLDSERKWRSRSVNCHASSRGDFTGSARAALHDAVPDPQRDTVPVAPGGRRPGDQPGRRAGYLPRPPHNKGFRLRAVSLC